MIDLMWIWFVVDTQTNQSEWSFSFNLFTITNSSVSHTRLYPWHYFTHSSSLKQRQLSTQVTRKDSPATMACA